MRNKKAKDRGILVLYVSLAIIGTLLLSAAFYYRSLLRQKPTETLGISDAGLAGASFKGGI